VSILVQPGKAPMLQEMIRQITCLGAVVAALLTGVNSGLIRLFYIKVIKYIITRIIISKNVNQNNSVKKNHEG
jgi:hypothetical protein